MKISLKTTENIKQNPQNNLLIENCIYLIKYKASCIDYRIKHFKNKCANALKFELLLLYIYILYFIVIVTFPSYTYAELASSSTKFCGRPCI